MRNNLDRHASNIITTAERRAGSIPVPAQDRRRAPRYALSLEITMHGENNFYAGLSEDISEGGIFIATHQSLPIGTPVVLTFTLPDSKEPLEVHGTVQWLRGPDATTSRDSMFGAGSWMPGAMPGIGVKFHGLDAGTLEAIHAFVTCRRPVFFDC